MREAGDINAPRDLGLPFEIQPSLAPLQSLNFQKGWPGRLLGCRMSAPCSRPELSPGQTDSHSRFSVT